MIRELLRPERAVIGLVGGFPQALDELLRHSSYPDRIAAIRSALIAPDGGRSVLVGEDVGIPHVRLPGFPAPELILGISSRGVALDGRIAHVLLLLVTPAEQSAQHLQLLQRLSSLFPTIAADLIQERDLWFPKIRNQLPG
jgi:mannitol/fructose-specific phosphotransferase system IIA component (Ntr-type)